MLTTGALKKRVCALGALGVADTGKSLTEETSPVEGEEGVPQDDPSRSEDPYRVQTVDRWPRGTFTEQATQV